MRRPVEQLVAEFLRLDRSPAWIALACDVSVEYVDRISQNVSAAKRCDDPVRCGYPQVGAGRPRRGWINLRIPGPDEHTRGIWLCSWSCVAAFGRRRQLTAVPT